MRYGTTTIPAEAHLKCFHENRLLYLLLRGGQRKSLPSESEGIPWLKSAEHVGRGRSHGVRRSRSDRLLPILFQISKRCRQVIAASPSDCLSRPRGIAP